MRVLRNQKMYHGFQNANPITNKIPQPPGSLQRRLRCAFYKRNEVLAESEKFFIRY